MQLVFILLVFYTSPPNPAPFNINGKLDEFFEEIDCRIKLSRTVQLEMVLTISNFS